MTTPREPSSTAGHRLRAELRGAPLRVRILLPIYLLLSGWGALYAGHELTRDYSNWLTWSIALLILEPMGAASLLALWLMIFPDSRLAALFERALSRAGLALAVIGIAFVGGIACMFAFAAWELWRLR